MLQVLLVLALLGGVSGRVWGDCVVVFNEVMYHPATNEPALEWVELHNQNSVDVDISGWRLTDGVEFTFPEGTVVAGRGYLVVAISPATLMAQAGITNVVGPFVGRLSNSGETLALRDLNNRLMDSVKYGVDGRWPVGPDGFGVSLAKRHPNLGSKAPENWTFSAQMGGTPGAVNFSSAPLLGRVTVPLPVTATWRYEDSGADLGTAWRATDYDDANWPAGAGLFFLENGSLPGPKTTPLAPARSTYYFRGAFDLDANPAARVVTLRPLVDDGAVIYVNGVEVTRVNMPAGTITNTSPARSAVGDARFGTSFELPTASLLPGRNVIAAEVHQSQVATNAGLKLSPLTAFRMSWDSDDGDFFSATSPALAPINDARDSLGTEAFASSNTNQAPQLIDGVYGSGSSWSPATNDFNAFLVLRFNRTVPLTSIAWSRDNGNTNDTACGGTCTDRSLGAFTLQYTLVTNPPAVLANSANPTNGWVNLAGIQYLSAQPGFTPHLRHRFDFFATNGNPILATGVRLRLANTNTIDEIEINPPAMAFPDAAFGLEISAAEVLPPPPDLVFNEISAASTGSFWLEVMNRGTSAVALAGIEIVRSGGGTPAYTLGAGTLGPGEILMLPQSLLGFGAVDQSKLSLYTPGRFALLDAVTVGTRTRGRSPDGAGDWQYPSPPTPGSSNIVLLHREIVLNEVMYHPPPFDPVPAITNAIPLVSPAASWRFNDSGADLGSAWRAPGYDDTSWPAGPGLFAVNTGPLPGATNTVLAAGRTNYYFRTRFTLAQLPTNAVLSFRALVDDGAAVYLNGTEIFRTNLPAGSISSVTPAVNPVGNAIFGGAFLIPLSNLVAGENILAAEVHQITPTPNPRGIVLSGGGLTLVEEGPPGAVAPPNLAREPGSAPFVIDSLSGAAIHNFVGLTDGIYGNNNSWIGESGGPAYAGVRFGQERTIGSFAFGRDNTGSLSDRTFGLYTLQYTRVASPGTGTAVTGDPLTGWASIGTLSYQGGGSGLFANPSLRHRFKFNPVDATAIRLLVPASGINNGTCIDELEVNPPDISGDVAFGAELVLVTTLVPGVPFTRSSEEWIELYNRSTTPVDLSGWRLDGAVAYTFPAATTLPAGGYLVAAADAPALRAKWAEVASVIVGNITGRMSAGELVTLKDSAGNLAGAMRIGEVGWSDGGGSSLELIDPRADSSDAQAWLDSDESQRSPWQRVKYRMVATPGYGPVFWNEFRVGLLDSGEVLLDDVSVVRDPDGAAVQLIQNGGFESGTGSTHWRSLGDHGGSGIIPDPGDPSNHVLKVAASAPARTSHNHVESTFVNNAAIVDGQEYEISFRARWLAGSPQLNTTAYFQKLALTTLLEIPARHGTPGAPNSRRVPNAGPAFSGLRHAPVVPQTNEPVTISVLANDPDGVRAASVFYRVNPGPAFASVPMTLQPDGTWTATLPGQPGGRIVQFYVSAEDSLGASAFAPSRGPESRALYQVADGQGAALAAHELRLIQLDADRDFMLNVTNVMSQQHLGGTVVYDRTEVFYDAGARLHGSAAGRARDGEDYMSYDLEFPSDHLFRGVQPGVSIDRSGRTPVTRHQDEIYILHMFRRAGLPCHSVDLCYFIAPRTGHTGTAILQLGAYNSLFVEEQFGTDGSVFNYDMTYEPSVTVVATDPESPKLPVPLLPHIGTDYADLGSDKEQYRSPFNIRHGERADDFRGIIRLCQTMGLPQAQFDQQIASALNLDEAMRLAALTILCGIADIYFNSGPSGPHNSRIFTPTDGGPAQFLPWDMDFVFYMDPNGSILPVPTSGSAALNSNFSKLMNNVVTKRQYLGQVNELCQTVFTPGYMTPWLTHYGSVVGQSFLDGINQIQSRRASALGQIPVAIPFAISNNGGNDFLTNTTSVTIAGSGWVNIRDIKLAGVSNSPAVTWTSLTNWQMTVPLALGSNVLSFVAYDRQTNVVGSDSITVGTTAPGGGPDRDGDGMPDAWETANRLDPLVNDAALDADHDGFSNLSEYLSGTDPQDPNSFLQVDRSSPLGPTQIRFKAISSRAYSVEWKESLEYGAWTKLKDIPARLTNRVEAVDDPYPLAESRLYRLTTPTRPDAAPGPILVRSPRSVLGEVGGSVALGVQAVSSSGVLRYQWQFEGRDIASATASNLVVTNLDLTRAGAYTVVVSDARGRVTNQPPALVAVRPQILTPPESQSVAAGTPVSFHVEAAGTAPLAYRWFFNGRVLTGETNATLLIPSAQPGDAGPYEVLVLHQTSLGVAASRSPAAVLEVR